MSTLRLKELLREVVANDTNYAKRDSLVFEIMKISRELGYPTSIRIEHNEGPEWPVFVVELPTGQVSWHMKNQIIPYDGHSTAVKLERCLNFANIETVNTLLLPD